MSDGINKQDFLAVLDIQEKSIEASSKSYNKLEEIEKIVAWCAQELKDANKILSRRPCITKDIPYAKFEHNVEQQFEKRIAEHKSLTDQIEGMKGVVDSMKAKDEKVVLWLKLATGAIIMVGTILGLVLKLVP